ncbi:MAG: acyltransferase family protein [Xanthomonadaceae bacterium]|nr:acyltransferase family protein [Xanthomonadaceae bacterium]MDP2184672.1 acyltransferase family protein [Xanthomonadales bacterium]
MDNLRALAMLAGVLFHAALAYSPLMHPYIPTADRTQSVAVDLCIWFLHLVRMPLFFLVAGFFAAMLVSRRGLGGLFRNLLRRIALPFVIFLPLVHAALKYTTLQAAATVQNSSPLLAIIRQLSQTQGLPEQLPGTSHLWFLYYLMYFYVLVWSAKNFGLEKLGKLLRGLSPTWLLGLLPLLLVPALASVSAPNPAPESFLPQFWAFDFYGPFFAFGYLLFGHEAMIERIRPIAPWLLAASLMLYGAFWYLLNRYSPSAQDPSAPLLVALLEAYISVWMTCVCLIAGKSLLNRSNPALRYLSDASYWTYIVHLPILFAIQYRLLDVELPWGIKFAASVSATGGLCLLSYHCFVRRTVIGDLLSARAHVSMVQQMK